MKKRKNRLSVYDEAESRLCQLNKQLAEVEKRLERAPEGSIRFIMRNGFAQYYVRKKPEEKGGTYIRKTDVATLTAYLQKYYDVRIRKALIKEQKELTQFLQKSGNHMQCQQDIYGQLPEQVREFIQPIECLDEEYVRDWLAIPYVGKEIGDAATKQMSNKGEYVRSKTELTIANALYKRNIPYKYECPLRLKNGTIIYPDFTVLHVKERKVMYWEHRGMMDDRDYAKHAVMRIRDYEECGIHLGEQLVITEETSTQPLSSQMIEKMIDYYFD